jgi:hypothetical protein
VNGHATSLISRQENPTASDNKKLFSGKLAHGRWFSPGTPASSTTKTGRHDIAEILLKVALNTTNQINLIKAIKTKATR